MSEKYCTTNLSRVPFSVDFSSTSPKSYISKWLDLGTGRHGTGNGGVRTGIGHVGQEMGTGGDHSVSGGCYSRALESLS